MTKNVLSRVFSVVVMLICGCHDQSLEKIKTVQSFDDIDYDVINSGSLVIFDVDETLVQPIDTFLINEHTSQGKAFKEKLIQNYPKLTHDNNHMASILLQEAQRPLLESNVIDHINKLKRRGVFVIACTAMNTGPYGIINRLEQWRYRHLKSLGFEGSFKNMIFQMSYLKYKLIFYKGVLATDLQPKGPIIGNFIDVVKLKIKDLVMIDDDYDYLLSVKDECEKRGINFRGYQYRGFKRLAWNEDLIQFQAHYLIKHKKWLSDKIAKDYLLKKQRKFFNNF